MLMCCVCCVYCVCVDISRGGKWKSLADIVVATPGRLVDHINKTPGFRLDLLRFLVRPGPGGPLEGPPTPRGTPRGG